MPIRVKCVLDVSYLVDNESYHQKMSLFFVNNSNQTCPSLLKKVRVCFFIAFNQQHSGGKILPGL